jgi:hypothetical protein
MTNHAVYKTIVATIAKLYCNRLVFRGSRSVLDIGICRLTLDPRLGYYFRGSVSTHAKPPVYLTRQTSNLNNLSVLFNKIIND